MQNLATGVGDLKKVLSNVKTRGVLGEIRLGNILEQILAPEQYEANVKTKSGSNDHVEFAIKLPGRDDDGKQVYLPIDAKFPQEDYVRLQTAYDEGDLAGIDAATRSLTNSIKKFAKDIHSKYIDPPNTTDFGIMFLPIEGLFAEVVRQPDLVAQLQREYKIIITGPTTLAAMLNSLQMGFKTLAIQKRSSEVWKILGAVKTEFNKFGGVLEKAQKKINEANKEIDTLVGTRTRMMMSKLKKVEELPAVDSQNVLENLDQTENEESNE
jgi:DNA recombination protein RmuC